MKRSVILTSLLALSFSGEAIPSEPNIDEMELLSQAPIDKPKQTINRPPHGNALDVYRAEMREKYANPRSANATSHVPSKVTVAQSQRPLNRNSQRNQASPAVLRTPEVARPPAYSKSIVLPQDPKTLRARPVEARKTASPTYAPSSSNVVRASHSNVIQAAQPSVPSNFAPERPTAQREPSGCLDPAMDSSSQNFAYYFIAYQYTDIAKQQSAPFVSNPTNAYDNRFFESFYRAARSSDNPRQP